MTSASSSASFSAKIIHDGERVNFVSDRPLSVVDLLSEAGKYFKTPFFLIHNGVIVDNSLQVSDYGENPVFVLVRREKHGRDEKVENVAKHQRM